MKEHSNKRARMLVSVRVCPCTISHKYKSYRYMTLISYKNLNGSIHLKLAINLFEYIRAVHFVNWSYVTGPK